MVLYNIMNNLWNIHIFEFQINIFQMEFDAIKNKQNIKFQDWNEFESLTMLQFFI